ncbi:MAG: site-specific integrase [Anaerolineae bacterium]
MTTAWQPGKACPAAMSEQTWHWPVDITAYRRASDLSALEAAELAYLVHRHAVSNGHWAPRSYQVLERLRRPVMDVLALTGADEQTRSTTLTVIVAEMHRRQRAFWGWTSDEWVETLCASGAAFEQRHATTHSCRAHLLALSYLLCDFQGLAALGAFDRLALARKVFGVSWVDQAVQRVFDIVTRWGYRPTQAKIVYRAVSEALLANRSPRLEDLTLDGLVDLRRQMPRDARESLFAVSRALVSLGILDRPLPMYQHQTTPSEVRDPTQGVADEWVGWCQRWRETTTLAPRSREGAYSNLLRVGRWVTRTHAEAVSPADWTRELAAEYVAAVDRLHIGEWATPTMLNRTRLGQPVSPKGKFHYLSDMSSFFRDLQEWGWIARRFDPRRCFAAPRSIRDLMGPKPRVLADDVWAKLLWAGLNLSETDLSVSYHSQEHYYPLAMVRALALVWLFAGLRSDEIHRLRVGCVRWQTRDATVQGGQDVLPKEAVCLLDIPTNKTSSAFTKPVDRVVGEAIAGWERQRPTQPTTVDRKTGEVVDFLFAYRGRQMSKDYLNATLIPLLCQKAGVQDSDARGRITSHRARSTIATQLANAKNPMTLFELQMWLGHRHTASTLNYVTTTPTKLAKAYADAGYFERNVRVVEVLIDQDAIESGRAASGEPWKFYDLGHGYCTYDFFDQCPHRMACAKCGFYVPKGSSQAQLLEGKANLQRMLQEMPLLDDERAAVEEGLSAMETLLARLADVPTPSGPTPRELGSGSFIPVDAVAVRPVQPAKSHVEAA